MRAALLRLVSHRVLVCVLVLFGVAACGSSAEDVSGSDALVPVNPNGKDPGGACVTGDDCKSGGCQAGLCSAQQSGPGGGTGGSKAGDGKTCKVHADCTTACGDDGKCATSPSCTQAHGGRSCGPNGTDDCCAVAKQGTFTVDKYLVTAGRMRAFIERFQGDIQGMIATLPAGRWDAAWNDPDGIPTDMASANVVLGPQKKKACTQGTYTGHTYWTPKTADDYSDFDQGVLDEKALNCVPWVMLQALCTWEGGHLATLAELKAAFTNGGTTKYPWGDDGLPDVDQPDPLARLNVAGGFATSPLPATYRKNGDGGPAEVSFLIAPPGRFPKGNSQAGIADAAGNLLEFVGDQPRRFVWKGDFEHHAKNASDWNRGYIWMDERNNNPFGVGKGAWVWGEGQLYGNAGSAEERNGYYAIGGRCAR